jgi:hypothetical protein
VWWRGEIVRDSSEGARKRPGGSGRGVCGDDPTRASNKRLRVGMDIGEDMGMLT